MIKLVILDFDGTLADTRELIVRTNQEVQRQMGHPIVPEERIAAAIGLPLAECIHAQCPDVPEEDLPRWVTVYRAVFDQLKGTIAPALFPHVRETIAAVTALGCRCSVASSRSNKSLHEFLEHMNLDSYFSLIIGANDVEHAKPHPEPVLKTLQALAVDPAEALVVGDMPVDIQMGLGAGTFTCGVSYGNSNREDLLAAGAHKVIDDFAELTALISRK